MAVGSSLDLMRVTTARVRRAADEALDPAEKRAAEEDNKGAGDGGYGGAEAV